MCMCYETIHRQHRITEENVDKKILLLLLKTCSVISLAKQREIENKLFRICLKINVFFKTSI